VPCFQERKLSLLAAGVCAVLLRGAVAAGCCWRAQRALEEQGRLQRVSSQDVYLRPRFGRCHVPLRGRRRNREPRLPPHPPPRRPCPTPLVVLLSQRPQHACWRVIRLGRKPLRRKPLRTFNPCPSSLPPPTLEPRARRGATRGMRAEGSRVGMPRVGGAPSCAGGTCSSMSALAYGWNVRH